MGSRRNAPHTGNWKKRWCVLQRGVLYYDPQMKMTKLRKHVALEHCDVSIDHYATPIEEGLHDPVIVLSVNAAKRRMKKEGELRFMSETERDGLDWLQCIDFQVASAKRRSEKKVEEGFEALASFLKDQRCRTAVKTSIFRGLSKYNGQIDVAYLSAGGGDPYQTGHDGSGAPPLCLPQDKSETGARVGDLLSTDSMSTMMPVGIPGSDIPVPRLNVVIMLVGTRGDVQPFLYLARRLMRKGGHNVRVATHAVYRKMVEQEGMLFYPLAGDPVKLSEHMVRSHGRIIPDLLNKKEMRELPEKMLMLRDILESTWPACTAPDPDDPLQRPFVADAIISNPVTYGHIHCAEALGAPLHLMFPQPWVPTHAFPHPLAGLPFNRGWAIENYLSYSFVEEFFFLTLERFINRFRLSLGLDPIRRGEAGANLIFDNQVPFIKMWSPSFVPKPRDWGPHVDVVGYFLEEKGDEEEDNNNNNNHHDQQTPELLRPPVLVDVGGARGDDDNNNNYKGVVYDEGLPVNLVQWLKQGTAPIFVGFGSMVIEDTAKLSRTIVGAARQAGVRVVLQSSWSKMGGGSEQERDDERVFLLGDCPHTILMPHMAAVVHHGGAGTTAAGLQAGKPTLICPFFGDQHFWGEMVFRAGVGVSPIPIYLLTVDSLSKAFTQLLASDLTSAAQRMARSIQAENGVKEAAAAFRRHLPVQNMVCDVSLFLNETMVARRWCDQCEMKMSVEVERVVHQTSKRRRRHDRHDYRFVDWGVVGPSDIATGVMQGFCGAAQEIVGALAGVVEEPLRGALEGGAVGAAQGLATGVINLVRRPVRGGIIFFEKISVGVCNQVDRGLNGEASLRRPKRYLFHRSWFDWGSCCTAVADCDPASRDNCDDISEERRREILNAYQLAKSAQRALARLQKQAGRRRSRGGLLEDVKVWWGSFMSLLQSTVFYRILVESRYDPASAPDCLGGCSSKTMAPRPPPPQTDPSSAAALAQESSWLAEWTNEQIRRYKAWYQGGRQGYGGDEDTATGGIPARPQGAGVVGMGGPLERDVSSDGAYRTELELALTQTLDLHPEVVQELATSLERAGIAGPNLNAVDFLWVFSKVVKRSKRLRRVFLIDEDSDLTTVRREVATQGEGEEAGPVVIGVEGVQEARVGEAAAAEAGFAAAWESQKGRLEAEDVEDDDEDEEEKGGEEEEKWMDAVDGTLHSSTSQRSLPPAVDELFRTYSQC